MICFRYFRSGERFITILSINRFDQCLRPFKMFCNRSGKCGTPSAIVATHQLFPSQAVITPNCAGRCTKHQTLERSRDFAEGSASGALGPTLVISGLTIRQARRGWALAGAPRLTLSEYYAHQTPPNVILILMRMTGGAW